MDTERPLMAKANAPDINQFATKIPLAQSPDVVIFGKRCFAPALSCSPPRL